MATLTAHEIRRNKSPASAVSGAGLRCLVWIGIAVAVGFNLALDEGSSKLRAAERPTAVEHRARGNASYEKKQYDEAIKEYSEAIHLDPTNAASYNDRAVCWTERKEFEKAIADFSEA